MSISSTRRRAWLAIALIVAATALALLAMGRPPICTCGHVSLWGGDVNASGNSQHLADWYSFSHVLHGLLFYALLWRLGGQGWPQPKRLAIAVAIEAGWELLENSPVIIERYRAATIALGYTGDSVLNSMSDIAMMMLGFAIAARVPVRVSVALGLAMELFTLAMIRDNLTLNMLMLVWPVDAIRMWQAGA